MLGDICVAIIIIPVYIHHGGAAAAICLLVGGALDLSVCYKSNTWVIKFLRVQLHVLYIYIADPFMWGYILLYSLSCSRLKHVFDLGPLGTD